MMLERYCRLCGVKKPSLTYIFDAEGVDQNLCQKIQTNLQIPVNEDDVLPKRVCATCLKKLNQLSSFAHDCQNAQIRLKELASQCETDAQVINRYDQKSVIHDGTSETVFVSGNCEALIDALDERTNSSPIPIINKINEAEPIVIKSEPYLDSATDVDALATPVDCDEEWEITCSPVDLEAENDSEILQRVVNKVCTLVKMREIHSDIENITTVNEDPDTQVSATETDPSMNCLNNQPYTCSACERTFSTMGSMQEHMKLHHEQNPFTCKLCPRSFTRRAHVIRHSYVHSGVKPFKCELCDRMFTRKCSLEKHGRIHGVCKKSEQPPKPQMFTEYPDGDKPFICNLCGAAFARRNYVQQHAIVHAVERPFTCTVCAYTFARPQHLVRHMRTHTGEKPYQCPTCKVSFSRKSYLRQHAKIHERQQSSVENASAGVPQSVVVDAQCTCEICGNSFSHIKYLRQHYRTHTGEKPFGCHDCGSSFSRKHHLRRHIRIHTGEKPFLCSICGTRFARKFYLKVHSITHSNDKPFVCTICGNAFARNTSLQQHMKTHAYVEPL